MTDRTNFENEPSKEVKEHVCQTLDNLISINRDAVEGYAKAAELLESQQYKEICQEFAEQRRRFVDELVIMTKMYGGVPSDSQSVSGLLHGAWMSIRDSISNDDSVVIAECDRGEEAAVESYHQAITDTLPDDVDTLLRSQYFLLRGSHERIHRLSVALLQ